MPLAASNQLVYGPAAAAIDTEAGPCQAAAARSEVTALNAVAVEFNSAPIPSQADAAASIGPEPAPENISAEFISGGNTKKFITTPFSPYRFQQLFPPALAGKV
jgi:hypothetical protein